MSNQTSQSRVENVSAARLREVLSYDAATGVFRWKISLNRRATAGSIAGSMSGGYRRIAVDGHRYLAHRLAWFYVYGEWPSGELDHWDGCPANNRLANLREATTSQNQANSRRPRDNTSGLKGVCFDKNAKKFKAYIRKKGKLIHLGYFDAPEAAHAAYMRTATELFGEFARMR